MDITLAKLEVLGDEKTLFPDVMATMKAAEVLIKDGFDIMVYTNDDPIIAQQLEQIGVCSSNATGRTHRLRPGSCATS